MLKFTCDACGHTKGIVHVNSDGDNIAECLECEHVEILKDYMPQVALVSE